ncbi:MAG: hypothetical protein AAF456_19010, partial [Planctomycetota bacterium]
YRFACLILAGAVLLSTSGCAWVAELITVNLSDNDEFDHIENDRARFEAEFIRNRDRERRLEDLKRRFPAREPQDLLYDTTFPEIR